MRFPILFISIWVLVSAKPELYREKEDFQYSRSSSDDGSQSGYYGAQRGNMGGNYEKAHNMDSLAQHQMSTLVRQVDGELGTGANTRSGSVFTAGNSRGIYGSGNYDLSNLKGRNFGEAYEDSMSSSASSSMRRYGHEHSSSNERYNNAKFQSIRKGSGFQSSDQSSSDVLMGAEQAQTLQSGLESGFENQADKNYKYYSQGSSNVRSSNFEENRRNQNEFNSNSQSRYTNVNPVKVYVRPGSRVSIPVSAQTYDASHFDTSQYDQNSINSDAFRLNSNGQEMHFNPITKHYESSYRYKKEWEKHDVQPIVIPTESPLLQNSALYDGSQISQDSKYYSNGYKAGSSQSSSSHQSRHQSAYTESQNSATALASSHSNDFLHEGQSSADAMKIGNMVESINSRPKSYHSSYSYHKAWERQGDPYVIQPLTSDTDLQTSQKLTATSGDYGHASSHQYGSQYSQSQQRYLKGGSLDCDEICGHKRVARSYNINEEHRGDSMQQQSQSDWTNIETLGQETQPKWTPYNNWRHQKLHDWDHWDNTHQLDQDKDVEELIQNIKNMFEPLDHPYRHQNAQSNGMGKHELDWKLQSMEPQNKEGKHYNAWDELEKAAFFNSQTQINKAYDSSVNSENIELNTNNAQRDIESSNSNNNKDATPKKEAVNKPMDIGRGDIGPEDFTIDAHSSEHKNPQPINNHKEKQPQDLGHKNVDELKNWLHNKDNQQFQDFGQHPMDKKFNNIVQQNMDQQLQDFGQQPVEEKFEQQNMDQQLQDFGQQPVDEKFEKINMDQQLQTFGQQPVDEKFEQQNMDQQLQDFGQKPVDEKFEKQNMDQQLQTFGQQPVDEKFEQQNMDQQLQDFGQKPVDEKFEKQNMEQQLQDFGQQPVDEKFEQQNMDQQLQDFGQQPVEEKFEQQNMDQQLQDFGQQPVDEKFEQQNMDQQLQDFGQQLVDEKFEKQNMDQQLQDFGQHPMDITFEQQNMDQQLQDFGQQPVDEKFEKQNMDQQLQDFGQQPVDVKFEQQNMDQQLQDFGQQLVDEKFEKQNMDQQLQDFGQHPMDITFEQQNMDQQLQDFGQHPMDEKLVNLEQQSIDQQLQDFGQQPVDKKFEQQSIDQQLQDFGQQPVDEKFEKQNMDQQLQDFGQHLGHETMENIVQINRDLQSQTIDSFRRPKDDHILDEYRINSQIPQENMKQESVIKVIPKSPEIDVPEEPVTEKQDFWSAVNNKFKSAKNTVTGWFKRS